MIPLNPSELSSPGVVPSWSTRPEIKVLFWYSTGTLEFYLSRICYVKGMENELKVILCSVMGEIKTGPLLLFDPSLVLFVLVTHDSGVCTGIKMAGSVLYVVGRGKGKEGGRGSRRIFLIQYKLLVFFFLDTFIFLKCLVFNFRLLARYNHN